MRYRQLADFSRRPISANGSLLLSYPGLAIACNCSSAETTTVPADGKFTASFMLSGGRKRTTPHCYRKS